MSGNRKSIRLKKYDYSQVGLYYVTICAEKHKCLFGQIKEAQMILNTYGEMMKNIWEDNPKHYKGIDVDLFQIMPNHIHGIIQIIDKDENTEDDKNEKFGINKHKNTDVGAGFPCPFESEGRGNRAPTLGQIIAYFKYVSTKQINNIFKTPGVRLWQRNFYEHIIRNEEELNRIREYISINPEKWEDDEYFMGEYG